MKTNVIDLDDKIIKEIELNQEIFGLKYRADIIHSVIRWQLAKRQSGTHSSKGISDIAGTTAKPYRQKGTGRARQGSRRSPQFRGGAVIFGPVVRSHAFSLNKKVRNLGLKIALSAKLQSNKLKILQDEDFSCTKTKLFAKKISALKTKSLLLVVNKVEKNLQLTTRNLHNVCVLSVIGINVYDLVRYESVLLSCKTMEYLHNRLLPTNGQ